MKHSAVVFAFAIAAVPASAAEPVDSEPVEDAAVHTVLLPGTGYTVVLPTSGSGRSSSLEELQQAIAAWLASEFNLPSIAEMPALSFASKRDILALRYRDVPSNRWGDRLGSQPFAEAAEDIVAVYDDEAKTIYLPVGWSGNNPGELSVLVHEMVHHIQNVAGLKFACPAERELTAFEAQGRWLRLFGSDLLTEFDLDPLTVLVRTHCLH